MLLDLVLKSGLVDDVERFHDALVLPHDEACGSNGDNDSGLVASNKVEGLVHGDSNRL